MTLLYKANAVRGAEWGRHLAVLAPELPFRLWPETGDPAEVRYLATWVPPDDIAATFPNLELVFSVGAGAQGGAATGNRRAVGAKVFQPAQVGDRRAAGPGSPGADRHAGRCGINDRCGVRGG